MSHNTVLSAAVGSGDTVCDYDLATGGNFPTTGKLQCTVLFVAASNGATPAPLFTGQAAMVASLPVVIASNQSALPASQSGTWTVQPGNTANTTAWLVTGTGGTFPITAASLPLPSGAATSAKQDTGNTSLSSIDGKLPALGQALAAASVPIVLTAAQLSTLTPVSSVTANAGTNLNTSLLALESGGNLATLAGAVTSAKVQANTAQINGVAPSMGNGASGTGVQRVTIASDSTGTLIVTQATATNFKAQAEQYVGGTAVSNSNPVPISDAGGSLTVDGTFWQATQPVSIAATVTVTGAGGTFPVTDSGGTLTVDAPVGTPVFVRLSDGSSAITTLPVSLASVPSHAVTNAGTFAVQESGAALTSLQLIDDAVYADGASWTDDTSKHYLVGGLYQSSPQTVTDGKVAPIEIDVNGNVKVAVQGTVTVGSHAVTNAGTFAVQATVAASATNIAKAEDVASADADVGVPAMAVRKATPANTSGTDGDYEMLQMSAGRLWVDASGKTLTVDGSGVTQPISAASLPSHDVTPKPTTSGGLTPASYISAGSQDINVVKNSAGQLYEIVCSNINATQCYLKIYDKATSPSSSDTPVLRLMIPGSATGAGLAKTFPLGIVFSAGISFRVVTGSADNNTTSVAASDVLINLGYK